MISDHITQDEQALVNYADDVFTSKDRSPKSLSSTETMHVFGSPVYSLKLLEDGFAKESCYGNFYIEERVIPKRTFDGLWAVNFNFASRWALYYKNMVTSYTTVSLESLRSIQHGDLENPNSKLYSGRTYTLRSRWFPTVHLFPRILAVGLLAVDLVKAAFNQIFYVGTVGLKTSYSFTARLIGKEPNLDGFNSWQNDFNSNLHDTANGIKWLALAVLLPERTLMMLANKVQNGTADNFFAKFDDLNGRNGVCFID